MSANDAFKQIYTMITGYCEKTLQNELFFDELDIIENELESAMAQALSTDEIESTKQVYQSKKALLLERYADASNNEDIFEKIFDILCLECADKGFCASIASELKARAELLEGYTSKCVLELASSIENFSAHRSVGFCFLRQNSLYFFKGDKILAKHEIDANFNGNKINEQKVMAKVLEHKAQIKELGVLLVWGGFEYGLFDELKGEFEGIEVALI